MTRDYKTEYLRDRRKQAKFPQRTSKIRLSRIASPLLLRHLATVCVLCLSFGNTNYTVKFLASQLRNIIQSH